jgi:hypothetical protein
MNMLRLALVAASAISGAAIPLVACSTEVKSPANTTPGAATEAGSGATLPAGSPDLDGGVTDGNRFSPSSDPMAAADIEQFSNEYAQAICERATSCCNEEEYNLALSEFSAARYNGGARGVMPPAPSRCVPELQKRLKSVLGRYATAVIAGRMKFERERAKQCTADMKAVACGPELLQAVSLEACISGRRSEVFKKLAAPGQKCTDLDDGTLLGDCTPALGYCGRPTISVEAGVAHEGTCIAWPKEGEKCGIDTKARFAILCDTLNGSYCSDFPRGICSRKGLPIAEGQSCNRSNQGAFDTCAAGTYCDGPDGGATCLPRKADGEPCADDDECKTRMRFTCARNADGEPFTCGSRRFCSKK